MWTVITVAVATTSIRGNHTFFCNKSEACVATQSFQEQEYVSTLYLSNMHVSITCVINNNNQSLPIER